MSFGTSNHWLTYPVLRGGTYIHNPLSTPTGGTLGTIGCIATTDGQDRWLISCYHVLCRFSGALPGPVIEPVFHTDALHNPNMVAVMTGEKSNELLDCAAARAVAPCLGQILGIGKLGLPADPVLGMRVIKSGAYTGVTEGFVVKVTPEVEIAPIPSVDKYDLSEGGDSGAIWVEAATMSPVALHYRGSDTNGTERAFAKPIKDVLGSLGLKIITE